MDYNDDKYNNGDDTFVIMVWKGSEGSEREMKRWTGLSGSSLL